MGGEDRGADSERQHEEGFSSLAAHYSHWEGFKDIHAQVHSKLLWGEAQAKILSEICLDELYNAARVGMPKERDPGRHSLFQDIPFIIWGFCSVIARQLTISESQPHLRSGDRSFGEDGRKFSQTGLLSPGPCKTNKYGLHTLTAK